MAGCATKRRGVGVIPSIGTGNNRRNCQDAKYGVREDANSKGCTGRWKEKVFQPIKKSLHVSSGEKNKGLGNI
jgi:hypothetical protein